MSQQAPSVEAIAEALNKLTPQLGYLKGGLQHLED